MLKPVYLRKFEGELEKAKKRGKDLEKIKNIMKLLTNEVSLPPKYRNHKLKGGLRRLLGMPCRTRLALSI